MGKGSTPGQRWRQLSEPCLTAGRNPDMIEPNAMHDSESDTVEAVDATSYLEDLCRGLVASVQNGTAISLKTDIENALLPTDRAIPIGLIVNELVTNAIKYAFPPNAKGTVVVTLKREPGKLRLTVADDGKGVDPQRADSGLGSRLVESFTQQLGGQLERESGNQGTTVRLILPSHDGAYG
jgi:two-component sensor histidine kinase